MLSASLSFRPQLCSHSSTAIVVRDSPILLWKRHNKTLENLIEHINFYALCGNNDAIFVRSNLTHVHLKTIHLTNSNQNFNRIRIYNMNNDAIINFYGCLLFERNPDFMITTHFDSKRTISTQFLFNDLDNFIIEPHLLLSYSIATQTILKLLNQHFLMTNFAYFMIYSTLIPKKKRKKK